MRYVVDVLVVSSAKITVLNGVKVAGSIRTKVSVVTLKVAELGLRAVVFSLKLRAKIRLLPSTVLYRRRPPPLDSIGMKMKLPALG